MTALCTGGGPSSVNAGVQSNLVYASGGVEALALFPGFEWLTLVAIGLGFVAYDLPSICATDPPGFPTFSTADKLALVLGSIDPGWQAAQAKLSAAIITAIWYQFCHCNSGAQPSLPAPTADPGGVTLSGPNSPLVTPCMTASSPQVACSSDLFDTGLFPSPGLSESAPAQIMPVSATSIQLTYKNITAGANHDSIDFTIYYFSSTSGGFISTHAHTQAPGTTTTELLTLPPGAVGFSAECGRHTSGSNNSNLAELDIQVFCGGLPGQPQAPCCPPSLTDTALLNAILQAVTLIQRQAVPFAYIATTVHSGLTGAGTIAIQGLLGVRVVITADSASLGAEGTTPVQLFERGYITFSTTDGALHTTRIEHSNQLIFPCNAGIYTGVSYDLNPLITCSITELTREP